MQPAAKKPTKKSGIEARDDNDAKEWQPQSGQLHRRPAPSSILDGTRILHFVETVLDNRLVHIK
jgi:hypothetical protein